MSKKLKSKWYLRAWRNERRLTQEQLAERAGLSAPFISQLEAGKRQYTQEVLEALAEALGCTPADLMRQPVVNYGRIWDIWQELNPDQQTMLEEIGETLKKRA